MYIASQIAVIIALIVELTGRIFRNKKHILLFILLANLLYTLSYVLLQSPLPVIANVIALVRTMLYMYYDKNKKSYKWYLCTIIIINVLFVTSVIIFWKNALDLVLIVSTLILSCGLALKSPHLVRLTLIVCSVIWMIYNLSLHSYMGFVSNVIGFVLTMGAFIFYLRDRKNAGSVEGVLVKSE